MIVTIAKYYAPGRSLPYRTPCPPAPARLASWRNCVHVLEHERRLRATEEFEERVRQLEGQGAMEGVRY
jgi:hypothetical protein